LTDAERILWQKLRRKSLGGFKFRRQQPVGPYILDFYCHQAKLAIELDGSQHAIAREYDEIRTAYLASMGIDVIRFWNNDVIGNLEGVLTRIDEALSPRPAPPSST
jgi:very-short-patch-repair endonuclease